MTTTLTFDQTGEFKALAQARNWCRENGYSYGSLAVTRSNKVGILKGDWCIAKWCNLSLKEKDQLDGYMHSSDFRNGPVFVFLKNANLGA